MNNEQYLRKISLVVGTPGGEGLDLSELHIKFIVRRGDLQTPNSLDVRIYNPSDQTVKQLLSGHTPGNTASPNVVMPKSAEFTAISLSAGYQNAQFGLIFQGSIIQCRFGRENSADTFIDIRAADGDEAYNFSVINTSLIAGSTPQQHFNAIATALGTPVGYVPPLPETSLPRGKVLYGLTRDSARDFAQTHSANWSIQDGKIQVCPLTQYVPGEIVQLNSATGMINWPEQTANGIHIRCLLNSNIKIGSVVQINNSSVLDYQFPLGLTQQVANQLVPRTDSDGYYVVWVSEHTGDTRGNEWYTDLTCLTVDSSVIPDFLLNKFAVAPPINTTVLQAYP